MDKEWIKLDGIELTQLKKKLATDFNIEEARIEDELLKLIQSFVEGYCSNDEYIKQIVEYPKISPPPDGIEIHFLLLPVIHYNINLKITTYVILGFLLDVYFTKGITSTILGLLGLTGKAITKIHKENGELCIYCRALILKDKGNKTFRLRDLYQILRGQDCKYLTSKCIWENSGKCNITLKGLEERCLSMKRSSVLSKTFMNRWKIEL